MKSKNNYFGVDIKKMFRWLIRIEVFLLLLIRILSFLGFLKGGFENVENWLFKILIIYFFISILIILLFGFVIMLSWIDTRYISYIRKKNNKLLFSNYPELEDNLANVERGASYFNKQFGLALYKDFMISFSDRLPVAD